MQNTQSGKAKVQETADSLWASATAYGVGLELQVWRFSGAWILGFGGLTINRSAENSEEPTELDNSRAVDKLLPS